MGAVPRAEPGPLAAPAFRALHSTSLHRFIVGGDKDEVEEEAQRRRRQAWLFPATNRADLQRL